MTRLTKRGERVLRGAFGVSLAATFFLAIGCAGGMDYADATHTDWPMSNFLWPILSGLITWGIYRIGRRYE